MILKEMTELDKKGRLALSSEERAQFGKSIVAVICGNRIKLYSSDEYKAIVSIKIADAGTFAEECKLNRILCRFPEAQIDGYRRVLIPNLFRKEAKWVPSA